MSSQQNMINRTDLVKPPQYAIEGTATTDYGKSLASPEFFCPVQKGKLSKDNQPQFIDKTFAGSIDRQGVIKVREQNRMTLSGWLIKDNLDIIEWAISEPNGSDTPEESRTWLYSYKNAGGNEVYCVAKGCKPLSCTITISKDQPAMVEVQMFVKSYHEGTSLTNSGVTGTPVYASEDNAADPLLFKDLGSFLHDTDGTAGDGTDLAYRSASVTCTWTPRVQDSNGSETDLFMDYAERRVTGSLDIFKTGPGLNNAARAGTQYVSFLELVESSTDDAQATYNLNGGTNGIKLSSKLPGATGNDISITVIAPQSGKTATTVQVVGHDITVYLKATSDTLTNIKSAIDASPASEFLETAAIGTQTTTVNSGTSKTNLSGGSDGSKKLIFERFRFLPSNEDLLDQSEATIEAKSFESDAIHFA